MKFLVDVSFFYKIKPVLISENDKPLKRNAKE